MQLLPPPNDPQVTDVEFKEFTKEPSVNPLAMTQQEIHELMRLEGLVHPLVNMMRWANDKASGGLEIDILVTEKGEVKIDPKTALIVSINDKLLDYVQPKLKINENTGLKEKALEELINGNTLPREQYVQLLQTLWEIFPDGKIPKPDDLLEQENE